jgi:RNA polymerase sigma-70 factor (ECF subfamily)
MITRLSKKYKCKVVQTFHFTLIGKEAVPLEEPSKLEQIYRQYKNLMFYTANQILHSERDAEDIVHSAFVKLAEVADKITEPVCPKTQGLVVVIVRRLAINQYNARKRRTLLPLDEELVCAPTEPVEEKESVRQAIAHLPDRYRELILLKYYQGFSDREIAKMLDMTPGNVARTVQRAKQKLRENLEQEGIKT